MWQLYVLHHGQLLVPARHAWVSSCQDGCAGIEGADDAGLGDGQGLLLHDLVQNGTRVVCHLVKLIDATYPIVTQHKSTSGGVVKDIRDPLIACYAI